MGCVFIYKHEESIVSVRYAKSSNCNEMRWKRNRRARKMTATSNADERYAVCTDMRIQGDQKDEVIHNI